MAVKIDEVKEKDINEAIKDFIESLKGDEDYQSKFLIYIQKKKEKIEKFIEVGKSPNSNQNQLIVLRRWNSYTPILPLDKDQELATTKGGGYFIVFENYGLVIDPGYNFIENFLNAGCKLDDIDAIFVTHAHDDHTVQLEAIFSLLYKRNKNLNGKEPKKIDLFMNLGSFKKFAGYFDLSKPEPNYYINRINVLNKHQLFQINNNIKLFTTEAKHHEMITENYALGLTFTLENEEKNVKKVIKFTSDTGWDSNIEKKNKSIGEEYDIHDIDILICHIGSLKENEMKYDLSKSLEENERTDSILYKYHLGIIGTVAEIHFWKPKITLVSEFGQELFAIRTKITERIQKEIKALVFAVDINFRLNIDNDKIRCFKSNEFKAPESIKYYMKDDGSIVFYDIESIPEEERLENFANKINIFV